jgi:pimeloyl-ACP methyl ester carboxylesterase
MRGVVLSLCVAGGLLLGCRAAPIPEAQRWPAGEGAFRTRDRVVDGTALRTIDTGSGPVVVFVHGLGSSMYAWRFVLAPVLAAGHRVVAFDNRGFGFSARGAGGYDNRAYARLLLALMDSLGVAQAVLVGHSMGGAIAAEAALAEPDRVQGLVLIGSAGYGVAEPWILRLVRLPLVGRLATAFGGRWTVRRLLRSTYADPARVTEADVDQYYAAAAQPGSARAVRRVLAEFRFDGLTGRLRQLGAPTLLVWGAHDRWTPLWAGQHMAMEIPRGALVVVPDAGHDVPEERGDDVARLVVAFLRHGTPAPLADLAVRESANSTDRWTFR